MELTLLRERLNKYDKGGFFDGFDIVATLKEIESLPLLPTKEDLCEIQVCLYWINDIKTVDGESHCRKFKYEFYFWDYIERDGKSQIHQICWPMPIEEWQKPILLNNIEFELRLFVDTLTVQESQLKRRIGYLKRLEIPKPFAYIGSNEGCLKDMFCHLIDHEIILDKNKWVQFKRSVSGKLFPDDLVRFSSSKAAAYFIKRIAKSPKIKAHKNYYIQGSKCYGDEKGQRLLGALKDHMPDQVIRNVIDNAVALLE